MPPLLKYVIRGQEQTHEIVKDEILIGRSTECDVQIPENSVSRQHARIFRDGEVWRVADMGSRNGTRINNLPGADKALEDGDRIHLPEAVLTFVNEDAPRESSAPSQLDDSPLNPSMQTMFRSAVDFSALASAQPQTLAPGVAPTNRLQRLVKVVSEASRAVLLSETLDQTFQKMLDIVFENMPVERGFIMLRDAETGTLVTRCVKQAGGGEITFSRTIAEKVCQDKVAVLTLDAQSDDRFSSGESIMALGIRSAMAAPLWNGEKVEGLICVDTAIQTKAFDEFDLDLLSALGNHLAVALEQSRLQEVALEKERLDRELSVARDIQMAFLPSKMPPCAGYDVAGTSRPAEQTGGDVFDVVPLDDYRLMLLLGDATGHGIGPALSVTQVRSMLRIAVRLGAGLDAAFTHINNQLSEDLADNRFVTAFLGVLDNRIHKVQYHAGGQGPMMHFRAATGECEWLKATTMPLGFMETVALKPAQVLDMAPGDILGLITDGVFEFENPAEEQFQTERTAEIVRAHHDGPMDKLVGLLLEAVDAFGAGASQNDDITIVLARRLPATVS